MFFVIALLGALRAALRTRTDLTLENLALRQQLALLRPQIEATEIRATRSRLLDVALAVVDTVERSAPCRKTADGNWLAPAELSRFLDLEVPSRASGQTTDRRGACGSRAYHGAGEPALGCATPPRRIAEARGRCLAA